MIDLKILFSKRNLYSGFLHLAIVALATQVVILANQNKELKNLITGDQKESLQTNDQMLLGRIEPINTTLIADTSSRDQLLFIFTTSCPFCRQSLPVWDSIVKNVEGKPFNPIAISLDSREKTIEYIERESIEFPVYLPQQPEWFARTNKISGVPQLIIRNRIGTVTKVWRGMLSAEKVTQVAEATGITINPQ